MQESGDGAFEVIFRKFQYFAQFLTGVLAQQFQNLHVVRALHQLLDGSVSFSFSLRFLYITWLRISMNTARPIRAMIAIVPPK